MVTITNFTVYKSSAGSGKTYTLVKEYLKIALGSTQVDRYRGILAITFTNKAANEMKERVLNSLITLSKGEQLDMLDDLCSELQENEITLTNRAKKVLEHMLHHYADIAISTIDKFVHKIVRTFAYDLKIPLNFQVEMDGEQLIASAVDQLLQQVGSNPILTKVLIAFTEGKTDEEKSWNIENDITSYAAHLLKEEGQLHVDRLKKIDLNQFSKIQKDLQKIVHQQEGNISAAGKRGLALIEANGIEHKSFSRGSLPKYFEYLVDVNVDKIQPTPTLLKSIDEDKWTSGKCPQHDKSSIENLKPQLTELFNRALETVNSELTSLIINKSILSNIYGLALLNELEKTIQLIKQEDNIIHISEFNKQIASIVLAEPAPFIYERLGERYKNYLVDEFQDTSELQFQNMLPLIDNSLASGNFNMLVGDGKQSIYRWRGGDVEQFSKLPAVSSKFGDKDLIKERGETLARNYNEQVLGTNYRSKKNIVAFNNWFFDNIQQGLNENYQSIYGNHNQKHLEQKPGGFVSVKVLKREDKETFYSETMNCILENVNQLTSDGYTFKDICVLSRKRDDANQIANFLVENSLPVISSDSLLIGGNESVNLLVALLQFLVKPKNHPAKVFIANSLITKSRHETLNDIIHSETKFLAFIKTRSSEFNVDVLLEKSLLEIVEDLIRIFHLNSDSNPFILGFLEFIYECDNRSINSISDFLEVWENKKKSLSIQIQEGENAITIMTIHKAKGLQFPAVIFPFANWKMRGEKYLWIDATTSDSKLPSALINVNENLEQTSYKPEYEGETSKTLLDNINLLYVAFTRPEERLYVISSEYQYHNLSSKFIKFLKTSDCWSDTSGEYKNGEEIPRASKNIDTLPGLRLNQSVFPHWKPRVEISLQAEDSWDLEGKSAKKDYGKLLHYTLSKINTAAEIDKVVDELFCGGYASTTEIEMLKLDISSIVNHTDLKQYFTFDLTINNEREIITSDGQILRPDKVLIDKDSATVIDYKTGLMSDTHQKQISAYGNALKEMGITNVTQLLVYTNPIKIVQV